MTQSDTYLDAGMRGFIVNVAKKEFWKVASYYEFQDLVQDGYLCYAKCKQRLHPRLQVDNPTKEQRREVQAFVARAFFNHISTLASKRMAIHEQPISQLQDTEEPDKEIWDTLLEPQAEEGTLRALIASAPAEIKQLCMLLASDGMNLLKFQRQRKGRRLLRETTNEYYCRLVGANPAQVNLVEQVRAYFRTT